MTAPSSTGESTYPAWVLRLPFLLRMPVLFVMGIGLWLVNRLRGRG